MSNPKIYECVILIVAVCAFNGVTASKRLPKEYDDFKINAYKVVDECSAIYNIDRATIDKAIDNDSVKYLNPCFMGCLYEKTGLIDDKGYATPEVASLNVRKFVSSSDYETVSEIIQKCSEKVNAGFPKNTCQSASILTPCLVESYDILSNNF